MKKEVPLMPRKIISLLSAAVLLICLCSCSAPDDAASSSRYGFGEDMSQALSVFSEPSPIEQDSVYVYEYSAMTSAQRAAYPLSIDGHNYSQLHLRAAGSRLGEIQFSFSSEDWSSQDEFLSSVIEYYSQLCNEYSDGICEVRSLDDLNSPSDYDDGTEYAAVWLTADESAQLGIRHKITLKSEHGSLKLIITISADVDRNNNPIYTEYINSKTK